MNIRSLARDQIVGHYLFNAMPKAGIDAIMTTLRVIELGADELLFNSDDPATHFYLIHEGRIKLSRLAPTGQEKVISVLHDGACFAEAVMFMEQERYPVTAQALIPTRVFGIESSTYKALLRLNPDSTFRLISDLSQRLRSMLAEIENLSVQNATHRVAHYFLNQLTTDSDHPVTLELDTSKSLLASRLSVEPETLSRIFHKLSDKGAIEVHGRSITIKNRAVLQDFS